MSIFCWFRETTSVIGWPLAGSGMGFSICFAALLRFDRASAGRAAVATARAAMPNHIVEVNRAFLARRIDPPLIRSCIRTPLAPPGMVGPIASLSVSPPYDSRITLREAPRFDQQEPYDCLTSCLLYTSDAA